MLTRRLFYSILARLRWGRPILDVYKHECVRTIKVPFGKKKHKGGKTPCELMEVRTILFTDGAQIKRGSSICFSSVESLLRDALEYDESMIDFAEFALKEKYDFSMYALLKMSILEDWRYELRREYDRVTKIMRKEEKPRRVTWTFFRNWVSVISRLQSELYNIRPPKIPDVVNLVLWWDCDTLELNRVCISMYIVEPEYTNILSDCTQSFIYTRFITKEWGLQFGKEDPPIPRDTYFTLDFDCFDYDTLEEVNQCLWLKRRALSLIHYAKVRGDVRHYEIYETERGYHIVVYTNSLVPVYRVRAILGDDMDRMKMDRIRFFVSGIHDTLFTHKEWSRIENVKPPRKNEWFKGDDISSVL